MFMLKFFSNLVKSTCYGFGTKDVEFEEYKPVVKSYSGDTPFDGTVSRHYSSTTQKSCSSTKSDEDSDVFDLFNSFEDRNINQTKILRSSEVASAFSNAVKTNRESIIESIIDKKVFSEMKRVFLKSEMEDFNLILKSLSTNELYFIRDNHSTNKYVYGLISSKFSNNSRSLISSKFDLNKKGEMVCKCLGIELPDVDKEKTYGHISKIESTRKSTSKLHN